MPASSPKSAYRFFFLLLLALCAIGVAAFFYPDNAAAVVVIHGNTALPTESVLNDLVSVVLSPHKETKSNIGDIHELFLRSSTSFLCCYDNQRVYTVDKLISWTKISWTFPKCLAILGRNFFGFLASVASNAGGEQFEISWTFGKC